MHISEGVLSAPILATGAAFAVAGIAIGLKKLRPDQVIICAMLSAAFFVGSLIHVPAGIASVHLLLNGLLGVLLGWAAIPAIFAALLLQAILFQYGGFTTLGVNTTTLGFAAVIAWYVFHWLDAIIPGTWGLRIGAFCGGFLGVALSACLTAGALAFTTEGFRGAAAVLLVAHLPVMFIEGFITMFTVGFIARIKPQMIALPATGRAKGVSI